MTLDDAIKEIFRPEHFVKTYLVYKEKRKMKREQKSRPMQAKEREEPLIPMGVDGVDMEMFEHQLGQLAMSTCKRVTSGRYLFHPLRERAIEKKQAPIAPKLDEEGIPIIPVMKYRILSIPTIRDLMVQKLLFQIVGPFAETQFQTLQPTVSFGYRSRLTVREAARSVHRAMQEGYQYVIDADIRAFFDEIPHVNLYRKLETFFGQENELTLKMLYRYMKTDRVQSDHRPQMLSDYKSEKPIRTKRELGVPQGGVLSGLLANIYMHDFDRFVLKDIHQSVEGGVRYVRYADDFVILMKRPQDIQLVFEQIVHYLAQQGLTVHPPGEKTRFLHCDHRTNDALNFLGFLITPQRLSVSKANILKYKKRILEFIEQIKNDPRFRRIKHQQKINILMMKIHAKLMGEHAFRGKITCNVCGNIIPVTGWMQHFGVVNDLSQLRSLDRWTRKIVHRWYHQLTGLRIQNKRFASIRFVSVVRSFIELKRLKRKNKKMCKCKHV